MLRNSQDTYGLVAKSLHWIIALLILGLLSVGLYMTGLDFSPFKLKLYGLHKSFGLLVLMLAGLRVLWRWSNQTPADLPTHKSWERALAGLAHLLLYAAMFVMPLSGWLMSSAGDFPAGFFGLFELPPLVGKDEALFKLFRQVHTISAYIIIGVVGLHMAGAFKHHFIDRDNTLQRMTSRSVGFWRGGFLALVAGILLATPILLIGLHYVKLNRGGEIVSSASMEEVEDVRESAEINAWVIDHQASSINFEVTQYGQPFTGAFKNFTGDIMFDPDNLEQSRADIIIDIASIKTGSDERDVQARSGEWFDVSQFPQARFVTKSFSKLDANRYEAEGDLTIRGVTLPVILSFTLDISDQNEKTRTAHMQAELTLQRLDFGIGQGQWQSAEAIGNPVRVTINLEARQSK